ncbi:3-phosphoshikimate 1-carboxyvinyltransferase [Vagococcus elongatus]|uniref:3-phosphoshikimate 1-carboxyvinyltransferase n=1 Tax=Vagococcus elongatus TaxID=180344 RepID=A0A430ASG4_9ENTE|nr:3-phosphoshikimate 1-carboxyvinyltransferase [Vagococcus elongatus]RSU11002.1 3-phosphoshikimate 1-carboxyvinyltransferase [Vagococcus elongatus]
MRLTTNIKGLTGEVMVPGDKSISHRSIMFGAIAQGETRIKHFLKSEDCLGTLKMFQKLGVAIEEEGEEIVVHGRGFEALQSAEEPIDIGNSGTTIRLCTGLLAGTDFTTVLTGDESISRRPMNRVMLPLREMGAKITGHEGSEFPPLTIVGQPNLRGMTYKMPVASAQVKSAILLAGLQAKGTTTVIEKEKTRDHTEDMIEAFGGKILTEGKTITLEGPQKLKGQQVNVPGDISSAAFFMVAGLIVPNSRIVLKNVGLSESRTGIIDVIRQMNGKIIITDEDTVNKSGTVIVETSELRGTEIGGDLIPRLIDELPVIALLATQAKGKTIIKDAEELKVKETNRIDATASELQKMGAKVLATEDGLIIEGEQTLTASEVTSYGDHRMGMMLAIAALIVREGNVDLTEAEAVAVSYPNFFEDLHELIQK